VKNCLEWILFEALHLFCLLSPRKLCLSLGRNLGCLAYFLDRKHRKIAHSNLQTAFGKNFPLEKLKQIVKSSFKHTGEIIMDLLKFPHLSEEKKRGLFFVGGEENLKEALNQGSGVLLFSGHYGNWELAPYYLAQKASLSVVARELDNPFLEKKLRKIRKSMGAKVILKKKVTRKILKSLRQGEMVAILIDQNVLRSEAVFVDFFGRKAATTPSLAAFYLRTKAVLLPVFCFSKNKKIYHLKILKPIRFNPTGNYDEDVLKITQICTKIIENQIRENPAPWFWFHNRWKTRPKEEAEKSSSR